MALPATTGDAQSDRLSLNSTRISTGIPGRIGRIGNTRPATPFRGLPVGGPSFLKFSQGWRPQAPRNRGTRMDSRPTHLFSLFCGIPRSGHAATRSASGRRIRDAPSPKARNSCGNVEHCVLRIGRQLPMSDAVENYLLRGRLSSLNRILLRVPVYEDI